MSCAFTIYLNGGFMQVNTRFMFIYWEDIGESWRIGIMKLLALPKKMGIWKNCTWNHLRRNNSWHLRGPCWTKGRMDIGKGTSSKKLDLYKENPWKSIVLGFPNWRYHQPRRRVKMRHRRRSHPSRPGYANQLATWGPQRPPWPAPLTASMIYQKHLDPLPTCTSNADITWCYLVTWKIFP